MCLHPISSKAGYPTAEYRLGWVIQAVYDYITESPVAYYPTNVAES